jgi:APA family basic amino acid/polyamine antiporter
VLGRAGATSLAVGGIVGSGIFFILGIAANEAGTGVLVSLLLAGAIATLTALSFAALGSRVQREGGEYQFVYVAFGRKVGFLGGLVWIVATAIAAVTVAAALASYLTVLVPVGNPREWTAAICAVFVALDAAGLRLSASVNHVLVAAKVGVLLFFIVVGALFVRPSHFSGLFDSGLHGTLAGAFLIFFAYAGFGKITSVSEEVVDPERSVPFAIVAAMAISAVLYLAVGTVAVGVSGAARLGTDFQTAPLAYVMRDTGIASAFYIVGIGAIAATANVLLLQVIGLSRTVYAMAENRQLPRTLTVLHARLGTPYRAQLVIGGGMVVGALALGADQLIALTSLGILGYYGLINLAAVEMNRRERAHLWRSILPLLGFAGCAVLVGFFLSTLPWPG